VLVIGGGEGAGDALVGVVVLAVDAVGVDPQEDGNAVAGAGATSVTARECAIRGCPATARPAPPAPAAARYPGPPRSPCSCSPGLGRRASPGVPRPASPPGSHPRGRMPSETRTTELPHTLMAAISRLLLSPARLNIVLQAVSCISLGVHRKVQISRCRVIGCRAGIPALKESRLVCGSAGGKEPRLDRGVSPKSAVISAGTIRRAWPCCGNCMSRCVRYRSAAFAVMTSVRGVLQPADRLIWPAPASGGRPRQTPWSPCGERTQPGRDRSQLRAKPVPPGSPAAALSRTVRRPAGYAR
jgi:hypothetical protein